VNLALCFIVTFLVGSRAPAAATPSVSPAPSPVATSTSTQLPTSSPSPTPSPSPSPIVPPKDAPAVRATTPPFSAPLIHTGPRPPDSMWFGDNASIAVPMTLHGGRPYIDVIVNGHPATLLVDSSAVTTLIDADALEGQSQSAVLSLQIADLRFPRLSVQAAKVRSYTETNLGVAADGIIGADLLGRYPVNFDFPNRMLTIYRDSHSAAAAQPQSATAAAMRVIDGRPAVEASLDGDRGLWFSLATGVADDVQLEPAVDHASRLARQPSLPYDAMTANGGESGRLVRARALALGGVTFFQPLVAIVNAQRPASELAGSLGANMLSKLNLFIDETSSNLEFIAPLGATSPALYDPSGIALVVRHGAIVIRDTIPGSPADAADLRPGDEIISLNGLAPATLDFTRELLNGSPGSKVVVVYRRWRITRSATLTLRVLL